MITVDPFSFWLGTAFGAISAALVLYAVMTRVYKRDAERRDEMMRAALASIQRELKRDVETHISLQNCLTDLSNVIREMTPPESRLSLLERRLEHLEKERARDE